MGEIAEAFGEVIRELGLLIPLALKRQFQGIYRPIPNGEDMIDYFLDPHPDEVLYSVWARLSDGLGYRRQQDVLHDLFGTMSAIPIVDLPCHLGYFFEHLPRWHTYTLDTLTCVEEDRAEYGECYWHRLHQIPGVEVCPKHKTFLEESAVRTRASYRISKSQFVTAERAIVMGTARKVFSSPVNDVLMEVALAISTLLERPYFPSDDHFILRQYHALLAQRGFMTLNGKVRTSTLLSAFADYYPSELLSLLHCEVQLTRSTIQAWQRALTYRSDRARHPLWHILLILFLGSTVESFLSREIPYPHPFKEGPWPCLNPVCEHYGQRHIRTYQAREERCKGLFFTKFTCSCGFVYSRSGLDHSDEDLFRRDAILAYGPLWEARLRELWFDPTIQLQEIAMQLGVVRGTINRQTARLQLPVPRTSGRTPRSDVKTKRKTAKDSSWYRTQWTMLVNATPGANARALQRISPGVYQWLVRHDKEWLMANRPTNKQSQISINCVSLSSRSAQQKTLHEDPKTRDRRVASAVKACAQSIMNEPGYPKKVTKRKISLALPEMRRLERQEAPLTALALQEALETQETFALRRIQWFVQKCQQEQRLPTRREFIESISINGVLHIPGVLQALNEAMDTFSLVNC